MGGQNELNGAYTFRTRVVEDAAKDLQAKRKQKLRVYIAAFTVIQIIVFLVFTLIFMRVKPPKVTLSNVQVDNIVTTSSDGTNSPSSSSFSIGIFTARLNMKNPNFGQYKYPNATIQFSYKGYTVGSAIMGKREVGMKSSQTSVVTANLSSKGVNGDALEHVARDVGSGSLMLSVEVVLNGKVALMMGVMKKKKTARMNCTFTVALVSRTIKNLSC